MTNLVAIWEDNMKSTGIVRKVDELGRVVIPIEIRRTLNINEKDTLEIFVESDKIILKKYVANASCHLTGEVREDNIVVGDGKLTLSPEGAKQLLEELSLKVNK